MDSLLAQLDSVTAPTLTAFGAIALIGLVMGVAPSSLPLFSVVVGNIAGRPGTGKRGSRRQTLLFSAGFVFGIAIADAILGALSGLIGWQALRIVTASLALTNLVISAVLVLIGLALLRIVLVPNPFRFMARGKETRSFGGALLLGFPFGLSTCPACTPLVLPVLGAAAATGDPVAGAALLFTFGVARGLPLLVAGVAADSVKQLERFAPFVPKIERIGGALVLIAALFFAYQSAGYFGLVPLILLDT